MIERVYLTGAAVHKQKDNSASLRFVMRSLRRQRVFFSCRRNTVKAVQRKATQSECGQAESITSGEMVGHDGVAEGVKVGRSLKGGHCPPYKSFQHTEFDRREQSVNQLPER